MRSAFRRSPFRGHHLRVWVWCTWGVESQSVLAVSICSSCVPWEPRAHKGSQACIRPEPSGGADRTGGLGEGQVASGVSSIPRTCCCPPSIPIPLWDALSPPPSGPKPHLGPGVSVGFPLTPIHRAPPRLNGFEMFAT